MENNRRKKKYLGMAFQRKILFLVFASAVIPAALVAVCMYYMIFNLFSWQIMIPEAIAYSLMPVLKKVNVIMLLALPAMLFLIWLIALSLSHRIAGPVYRIEKVLDDIIAGRKQGPIRLRGKDELKSLVEKINKLICK